MSPTTSAPGDEVGELVVGEQILHSDWVQITQDMINGFGQSTLDPDPMHVDPEWARTGPFGHTIAFGFLTISLLTHLLHSALGTKPVTDLKKSGFYLNYGFDRLRLVAPVPVGSRVRGRFVLASRAPDEKGRLLARFDCTIEIEGKDRPVLVAEWLSLWVPPTQA